ncbi:Transcription factor bHLH112 [Apostasia shenzhenica]|uniref:Transcription factor bHLH112 n=1 Tax=Apostasia shenzhenica TaxID=1088818 RepID=A0A2I0B329_9ASPA|nr:Transcription factor bHLH112 [Apostasia shenzhenica]
MADEYQLGPLCSEILWSSSRCADMFSCSTAFASAGDLAGSFGLFPQDAETAAFSNMPTSGDNSPGSSATLPDFYEPQFFVQIPEDSPPAMDSPIFPSVNDHWSQSFLFGDKSDDPLEEILAESAAMDNQQYFCSSFSFPPLLHHSTGSENLRRGISGDLPRPSLPATRPPIPKPFPEPLTQQPNFANDLRFKRKPAINAEASTSSSFPAAKRPRIETPSPLPTFKVRKEKLGDRITALQQLVSPFGKTDTASVLHEAIEYIKFLHEQVRVLSNPYLRNERQVRQQHAIKNAQSSKEEGEGRKADLCSRGLCLAPISSTFAVINEIPPLDFWPLSYNVGC